MIAKNAEEVSKYLSAEKVVELLDSVNNADILLNIARSMASITTAYGKIINNPLQNLPQP